MCGRTWNQILPQERDKVFEIALMFPNRSHRQISWNITDTAGFAVSESPVFRILNGKELQEVRQEQSTESRPAGQTSSGRPMPRIGWLRIGSDIA